MKTSRMNAVIGATLAAAALQFAHPLRADGPSASEPKVAELKFHTTSGTLSTVDNNQRTVGLRHVLMTKNFSLAGDCAIALGNKPHAAIADLKPGMTVKIRYTDADGVLVANRIDQQKENRTGSIRTLDAKERTLTLDAGAFRKQFRVGDECKFVMGQKESGNLNDLTVGQRISVEYVRDGDQLMAIRIEQPRATVVGMLNAIDADSDTVKIKGLLSNQKFNLANDCRIVVHGKPDGRLKDLRLGQKVAIDYRDVNGVYVATRIAPANGSEEADTVQVSQTAK
jgi:hypothetical protein